MGSYWFTDMGMLNAGNFVEVKMNIAANIRIMSAEAFEKYKKKEAHDFIGGYVKFTPYTVRLPNDGHWFIVADRGGKDGAVNATVTVYPKGKKTRDKQVMLPEEPIKEQVTDEVV